MICVNKLILLYHIQLAVLKGTDRDEAVEEVVVEDDKHFRCWRTSSSYFEIHY